MMNIESFLELNIARQSCRDYDSSRDIEEENIVNCVCAATQAPSACNKQPARFIIVKDAQRRAQICADALLPGIPMPWIRNAPVIAVLCAVGSPGVHWFAPILSGVQYDLVDAGIAGEHFVLAATAQGIGTCWIGWFKPKTVRRILNIPKAVRPVALITMGYPASTRKPTPKKTVEEIMFTETWKS